MFYLKRYNFMHSMNPDLEVASIKSIDGLNHFDVLTLTGNSPKEKKPRYRNRPLSSNLGCWYKQT